MRNLLLSITLIVAGIILMSVQLYRYSNDVSLNDWHSNTDGFIKANLLQKQTQKPILLFFYTDWCPNCESLRENILATSDVKEFLNNTIPVKINPESGPSENQLSNEFGVMGYPTLIVISPSQQTLSLRGVSNISPQEFILKTKKAINSLI